MTAKNARHAFIVSLVASGAVITLASMKKGKLPEPRRYIGLLGVYFLIGALLEISPRAGGAMAVLAATTLTLVNGQDALATITGAKGRAPTSEGSIVGDFSVGGGFGGGDFGRGGGKKSGNFHGSTSPDFSADTTVVKLPLRVSAGRAIYVAQGIKTEVVRLCDAFNVYVTSGKRYQPGSDHHCGAACDFGGSTKAQKALYDYATGVGKYAYIEPWKDSHTIGVMGTTGPHVHISFFRCGSGGSHGGIQ
jgi:hypothetical protein